MVRILFVGMVKVVSYKISNLGFSGQGRVPTLYSLEEYKMSKWKKYKKIVLAEMRPYEEGEVLKMHIPEIAFKDGSPKIGDMIARNPKNHNSQWLVEKQYYIENFKEIENDSI